MILTTRFNIGGIHKELNIDGNLHLTEHFQYYELANTKASQSCKLILNVNTIIFANLMEQIRKRWGMVIINSWYRTPEYNKTLEKSVQGSLHCSGTAADFSIPNLYTLDREFEDLKKMVESYAENVGSGYEIIRYDDFVHVALDFKYKKKYVGDRRITK